VGRGKQGNNAGCLEEVEGVLGTEGRAIVGLEDQRRALAGKELAEDREQDVAPAQSQLEETSLRWQKAPSVGRG
jgi:hypothetical protein